MDHVGHLASVVLVFMIRATMSLESAIRSLSQTEIWRCRMHTRKVPTLRRKSGLEPLSQRLWFHGRMLGRTGRRKGNEPEFRNTHMRMKRPKHALSLQQSQSHIRQTARSSHTPTRLPDAQILQTEDTHFWVILRNTRSIQLLQSQDRKTKTTHNFQL